MSPPISTRRAGSDMNVQSIIPVFDPAGPYAGSITTLSWVLIAMAAGVFAIVLAALWIALFGSARLKARLGGPVLVWARAGSSFRWSCSPCCWSMASA